MQWSRIDLSNINVRRHSPVIYVYVAQRIICRVRWSVLRHYEYNFNDRKLYYFHTTRSLKTQRLSLEIMEVARQRIYTAQIVVLLRYSIRKTQTNYHNYDRCLCLCRRRHRLVG